MISGVIMCGHKDAWLSKPSLTTGFLVSSMYDTLMALVRIREVRLERILRGDL